MLRYCSSAALIRVVYLHGLAHQLHEKLNALARREIAIGGRDRQLSFPERPILTVEGVHVKRRVHRAIVGDTESEQKKDVTIYIPSRGQTEKQTRMVRFLDGLEKNWRNDVSPGGCISPPRLGLKKQSGVFFFVEYP